MTKMYHTADEDSTVVKDAPKAKVINSDAKKVSEMERKFSELQEIVRKQNTEITDLKRQYTRQRSEITNLSNHVARLAMKLA